jgi:hypothetical protein
MATSDNSIREFVQGQYAVLLLDHVAEFKSDFIRIVFEDALLGMVLESPSPFQKRLSEFFTTLDGDALVQRFEAWRGALYQSVQLEGHFEREKSLLRALPALTTRCVTEFKKNWLKEAAGNEQQARQLAKGFVHDDWFRRQVVAIPRDPKDSSEGHDYRNTPSLGWLFHAVLFLTTPQSAQGETSYGELHLVLPQLLKDAQAVSGLKDLEFERCFPVKDRLSFAHGSAFMGTLLKALKADGKTLNADCPPVFSVGRIHGKNGKVGVLTGLTTLFYDTAASTGEDEFSEKFAALSYILGNCNCIQFLPRPSEKQHYGFFQLGSCVPGLIHAIWPALVGNDIHSEFPPPRTDSSPEPDAHTRFVTDGQGRLTVIELPVNWFNGWWNSKLFSEIAEKERPAQITNRIRHYHNAWPDKLWAGFERLQLLSEATAEHVEKLAEAEVFRKSHQMLKRLETPLRDLTRSLDVVQSRTQDLRSVIYEPEEGLFGSYPLIKDLFDDHRRLEVASAFPIKLSHDLDYGGAECHDSDPEKRRAARCKLDGRTVWAVALCRIFGLDQSIFDKTTTRQEVIQKAHEELAKKGGNPLWEAVQLICLPLSNAKSIDFKALLSHEPVTDCLQRLKYCCFDPFKLHSDTWRPIAIALALRRYGLACSEIKPAWQKPFTINSEWSPIRYSSVLGFLLKSAAGISPQHGSKTGGVVSGVNITPVTDGLELEIVFKNGVVDTKQYPKAVRDLRTLVNSHILRMPRDWRIEASTVGNFQQPFFELASNIIGMEHSDSKSPSPGRWIVDKANLKSRGGYHEIIKVVSPSRAFLVEAAERGTVGGIKLKWIPRTVASRRKMR